MCVLPLVYVCVVHKYLVQVFTTSTTISPQPQSFPHYQISDGGHGVQNAITTVGIEVGIVQLWSILLPPNHVTPQTCCFGRHVSSSSFPFTVVQKSTVTTT